MAELIVREIPVGPFRSVECQPVIQCRWPDRPMVKMPGQQFGAEFAGKLWPILEDRCVRLLRTKPRKYQMTEKAKGRRLNGRKFGQVRASAYLLPGHRWPSISWEGCCPFRHRTGLPFCLASYRCFPFLLPFRRHPCSPSPSSSWHSRWVPPSRFRSSSLVTCCREIFVSSLDSLHPGGLTPQFSLPKADAQTANSVTRVASVEALCSSLSLRLRGPPVCGNPSARNRASRQGRFGRTPGASQTPPLPTEYRVISKEAFSSLSVGTGDLLT